MRDGVAEQPFELEIGCARAKRLLEIPLAPREQAGAELAVRPFHARTPGKAPPNTTEEGDMSNWDEVEGEAKERAGKLTDDDSTENEGRAQKALGDVKEKGDDAKDEIEERI